MHHSSQSHIIMFGFLHIRLIIHNPTENYSAYVQLLHTCVHINALSLGKYVQSFIAQRRFTFATCSTLQNRLIYMYVKCGSLVEARKVFDHMKERNNVSWNTIITAYRRYGYPHEAVTLFHHMQRTDLQPDEFIFASVLSACSKMGALELGIDIHQSIKDRGFLSDARVVSALLDMYAKCGRIEKTSELFDRMPQRDVHSWTAMIAGYAQNGFVDKALQTFKQMQLLGVKPNSTTFASVLPACAKMGDLEQGMKIHESIKEGGIFSDVIVATALIDMYAKCGSIEKAQELFDTIPQKDVISWNAMIAGYAQNGFGHKALQIFEQMQSAGVKPNTTTFSSILPVCAKMGALEQGIHIHQRITEGNFLSNIAVGNAMVDMYAKCGSIEKAQELFDRMPHKNVVSWNTMIAGYGQNGLIGKALRTFKKMQLAGVNPNSTTFASLLPACAKIRALEQGMNIHRSITEEGFLSDVTVATALIDMYAKCGNIDKAAELFDRMPERDVISWNAAIAGYVHNDFFHKALKTFKQMQLASVKSNSTTFASILHACAKIPALEQGINIHRSVMEGGLLLDIRVRNALVDMYAKCAIIDKARQLFDRITKKNVVSWTVMIAGYTQNECVEKALETFKEMQLTGLKPDSTTFTSILSACAKIGALEQGMEIHQNIMEGGLLSDVIVATALVDMYAKCGNVDKAHELFERMPQRNVVSWTVMIAGYIQNGFADKALEMFKNMQLAGIKPNSTTFTHILPACAKMGALKQGVDIHQSIMGGGFSSDVLVSTALVDMYSKCGSIETARELFDTMPQKDVISWNAMIAGYAQSGFCKDSLQVFELMKHSGTYPDIVTFGCVLYACSHAGLLNEGCAYFNDMRSIYCITPTVDHYTCMVDLLARAGYLEDTLNFIIKMPVKPMFVVWMCFLGACRSHLNIGLGLFTAMLLFDLDPENPATYVLLSNIYADMGSWGEVQIIRRLMKDKGIRKIPGCSWIEDHKMVHAFCVGDRSHPQTQKIYAILEKLAWEMKAAGYFPDSSHLPKDVEEEEKELFLGHHSEKLAIAFGLLNTSPGTTIRVVKNLRVCADCHTATKFISKIVSREIVVRDASRFHHFKEGKCSCGDYW